MDMDADYGLGLMSEAIEQDKKDKLYQLYVQAFTTMDKDSYVSFESFYGKTQPNGKNVRNGSRNVDKALTKEEVLDNVRNIMENYSI